MHDTVPSTSVSSISLPFKALYIPRRLQNSALETNQINVESQWSGSLVNLTNNMDVVYETNVGIGKHNASLQIDTGSSDLWVRSLECPQTNSDSDSYLELIYGLGSASGFITRTAVSIGNYTISNQALLCANKTKDQYVGGILPLGLPSLSSIEQECSGMPSAQPPLSSIFENIPPVLRFFALALERALDSELSSGGHLSIAEHDSRFASAVSSAPLLPSGPRRWTASLEGVSINGKKAGLSSAVPGAMSGTSVALIDSGTSLAYMDERIVNLIYTSFEEARQLTIDDQEVWVVPCLGSANVAFTFGSQIFYIDPLDLTTTQTLVQNGNPYTVCVNTFMPQFDSPSGEFDCILGDSFMRNVYTVFNFETESSKTPSIQMVPRTNIDEATRAFVEIRNRTLASLPPLVDPRDIVE